MKDGGSTSLEEKPLAGRGCRFGFDERENLVENMQSDLDESSESKHGFFWELPSLTESSGSSPERESSLYSFRGLRRVKVFSSPEIPFALKFHNRSPIEILQNKVQKSQQGGSTSGTRITEGSLGLIEREIHTKLFYISVINTLKEGNSFSATNPEIIKFQRNKELADLTEAVDKVKSLILEMENFEIELKCKLSEAYSLLEQQKNVMKGTQKIQDLVMRTVLQELVSKVQLKASRSRISRQEETTIRKLPNLFDFKGQLENLSEGEHGSKLIIRRLREGTEEERSLLWRELGLPYSLPRYVDSIHVTAVILAFVSVDQMACRSILSFVIARSELFSDKADSNLMVNLLNS